MDTSDFPPQIDWVGIRVDAGNVSLAVGTSGSCTSGRTDGHVVELVNLIISRLFPYLRQGFRVVLNYRDFCH